MSKTGLLVACAGMALIGCGMTTPQLEMTGYDFRPAPPAPAPVVPVTRADLVPYPDLDVELVIGAPLEMYHCEGRYFCYADGGWFASEGLTGTWSFVEPKRVPGDLYRARGHLPPDVDRAALLRSRRPGGELVTVGHDDPGVRPGTQ